MIRAHDGTLGRNGGVEAVQTRKEQGKFPTIPANAHKDQLKFPTIPAISTGLLFPNLLRSALIFLHDFVLVKNSGSGMELA